MQRWGAKTDPRRRPILVWPPHKAPSRTTSPPVPGRDQRGTWSCRRRRRRPRDLAAAPPVDPPPIAAVDPPTSPPTPGGVPGTSPSTSPPPDPIVAAADRYSFDLPNVTEVSIWCSSISMWTISVVDLLVPHRRRPPPQHPSDTSPSTRATAHTHRPPHRYLIDID